MNDLHLRKISTNNKLWRYNNRGIHKMFDVCRNNKVFCFQFVEYFCCAEHIYFGRKQSVPQNYIALFPPRWSMSLHEKVIYIHENSLIVWEINNCLTFLQCLILYITNWLRKETAYRIRPPQLLRREYRAKCPSLFKGCFFTYYKHESGWSGVLLILPSGSSTYSLGLKEC